MQERVFVSHHDRRSKGQEWGGVAAAPCWRHLCLAREEATSQVTQSCRSRLYTKRYNRLAASIIHASNRNNFLRLRSISKSISYSNKHVMNSKPPSIINKALLRWNTARGTYWCPKFCKETFCEPGISISTGFFMKTVLTTHIDQTCDN